MLTTQRILNMRWRVGDDAAGRTVLAQFGSGASDADPVIGFMDGSELADEVVVAHNALLEAREL